MRKHPLKKKPAAYLREGACALHNTHVEGIRLKDKAPSGRNLFGHNTAIGKLFNIQELQGSPVIIMKPPVYNGGKKG
ncbi:Hypothetical predicted protein, partial [Marmota monax]